MTAPDPRYPIGPLQYDPAFDAVKRAAAIDAIACLPAEIAAAVRGLDDAQLDTPYRDEGWTVRQVVHHVADSHANAYVRSKLVATEDHPILTGYDQDAWSAMVDARTMPIELSLAVIDGLHQRWAWFLRGLPAATFARAGEHTEYGAVTLDGLLQTYSWHGRHHTAHITELRKSRGWF